MHVEYVALLPFGVCEAKASRQQNGQVANSKCVFYPLKSSNVFDANTVFDLPYIRELSVNFQGQTGYIQVQQTRDFSKFASSLRCKIHHFQLCFLL